MLNARNARRRHLAQALALATVAAVLASAAHAALPLPAPCERKKKEPKCINDWHIRQALVAPAPTRAS